MLKRLFFFTVPFLIGAAVWLACGPVWAQPFGTYAPPQGWFWYREPPAPAQKTPSPEVTPKLQITKKPVQKQGPAFGSVAWIRKYLPKYRNRAIDRPTRTNVVAYMALQQLMMEKSQRFSNAVTVAVKTTPSLDAVTRRPTSAIGTHLANNQAALGKRRQMAALSKRIGIWFFYSNSKTCPGCSSQALVLKGVREIYGMPVAAISMDGSPPPPPLTHALHDRGQVNRLNIQTPMALYLVNPATRQVVPIGAGVMARGQIVDRVLLAAHAAGWLSDKAYDETRPMRVRDSLGEQLVSAQPGRDSLPIAPADVLKRLNFASSAQLTRRLP